MLRTGFMLTCISTFILHCCTTPQVDCQNVLYKKGQASFFSKEETDEPTRKKKKKDWEFIWGTVRNSQSRLTGNSYNRRISNCVDAEYNLSRG